MPVTGYVQTSNNKAALDVIVEPTTLPTGYRYIGPPIENVFRNAAGFELTPFREIVNTANKLESKAEIYSIMSRMVVGEILIQLLVPRASLWVQMGVGIGLDQTVLEGIYTHQGNEIKGAL